MTHLYTDQISDLLDTLADDPAFAVDEALRVFEASEVLSVVVKRLLDLEAAGGGAMMPSANWCRVDLNATPTLNVGSPVFLNQQADIGIHSQSGSDFSVGATSEPVTLAGAIISASGGWFQAACYAAVPGGVTLDLDSGTDPRWMEFYYSLGSFGHPFFSNSPLGVDVILPVGSTNSDLADLRVSVPGYVEPGGTVLYAIGVELVDGVGTDEITGPFDNFGKFIVWQTGPAE